MTIVVEKSVSMKINFRVHFYHFSKPAFLTSITLVLNTASESHPISCDILQNLKHFVFRTMDVLSMVHDFGNVFSCCERCTKNKRCKQTILVITFILMSFDLVTDWINWKLWLEVGGYSFHYLVFVFKTTFLCVAVVGTVIYTTETIVIVLKLFRIHRMETIDIENPSDERRVSPQEIRGFCEQEIKVNEAEIAVKKIIEEQEKKVYPIDKSPPGKVRDGSEEQEETLNEGDISSPGNVKNDSQEQEDTLNKGDISSPGKVRDNRKKKRRSLIKQTNPHQKNLEKTVKNRRRHSMKKIYPHQKM